MRKLFFASMVAMIAAFASCNKIETAAPSFDKLELSFDVADPASDTKAIKTSWEEGDEILILFRDKTANGQQAKLKYVSGDWTVVQKPSGLDLAVGNDIRFYAIHFPGTISYDVSASTAEQMGYVGGNVRIKEGIRSGALTEDGVLPLGTINLDEKLSSNEFQIVIPGISAETLYTLSVTNNGHISKTSGRENDPYNWGCAYAVKYYPYFTSVGTAISYGGGISSMTGVANADGVAFTGYYSNPVGRYDSEVKAEDPYKYVFSLYDGENYYYYTIAKSSEKEIAAGKAIKLPAFDGKGAQTYWKTSL